MVNIWLPVSRNTLADSYANWYSEWKNHADSKCDNQPALIAIPDYNYLKETIIYMLILTMLICNLMYWWIE